jgi:hypothetical protein
MCGEGKLRVGTLALMMSAKEKEFQDRRVGSHDRVSIGPVNTPITLIFTSCPHFHPIHIHPLCAVLISLTHPISHPRILTTATGPHLMTSATDLESGQGAQAAPRAGAFALFLITVLGKKC